LAQAILAQECGRHPPDERETAGSAVPGSSAATAAMAFGGCCSMLCRVVLLAVAGPLLLAGTLLSHMGHHLQRNGAADAEYAAAEFAAAAGLQKQAATSATQATEDQAVVAELEGDVARHGETGAAEQAAAGEDAATIGTDEAAAATEAGEAAVVQEIPGVNVAADVAEGTAIAGEQVSAVGSAADAIKNEAASIAEGAQAGADEDIVAEKEAEASSLEAGAATEQAGSVAARSQAVKSSLMAAGYFTEATVCTTLAAFLQAPVALAAAVRWLSAAGGAVLGGACCGGGVGFGVTAASKARVLGSLALGKLALVAALGALLAGPWAETVVDAASFGGTEDLLAAFVSLPEEAVLGTAKAAAVVTGGSAARALRGAEAEHKKPKVEEPSWIRGMNPFRTPNTKTSTVVTTTVKPPATENRWDILTASTVSMLRSILQGIITAVEDVALISVAFAVVDLIVSVGRHAPLLHRGSSSFHGACRIAVGDALMQWVWGLGLLVAIWLLSIILADELLPWAQQVQDWKISSGMCLGLGALCIVAFGLHAFTLETAIASDGAHEGAGEMPVRDSDSVSRSKYQPVDGSAKPSSIEPGERCSLCFLAASCLCAVVAGGIELLLQAAEGPVYACAVGGAYKAIAMWWLLSTLAPWKVLEKDAEGWLQHMPIAPLVAALGVVVLASTTVLYIVLRACRQPASREMYSPTRSDTMTAPTRLRIR